MLRCLPTALDPGPRPTFSSPADVASWAVAVDWIVKGDRAVVLHLDAEGRLTCMATTHSRLYHIGSLAKDEMAREALACEAAAVVAVDVRIGLPSRGVTDTERRRHHSLRRHLAIHGVALLDTVIVAPGGGLSVTGVLSYPLGGGLSWLQIHVPRHTPADYGDQAWSHQDAAVVAFRDGLVSRPMLWGDAGEPA